MIGDVAGGAVEPPRETGRVPRLADQLEDARAGRSDQAGDGRIGGASVGDHGAEAAGAVHEDQRLLVEHLDYAARDERRGHEGHSTLTRAERRLRAGVDDHPDVRYGPKRVYFDHRPSILQDYDLGRPMEIESIVRAPVAFARSAGIDTPTLDAIEAVTVTLAASKGLYSH